MTEERAQELYQIGYRKGYNYAGEYIANGNKKPVRYNSSKADMTKYTKEEKTMIHKGYRAGYAYHISYPDRPCRLDV